MRFIKLLTGLLFLLLLSCKKEKVEEIPTPETNGLKKGMLVLCEGLFQHNNSSISWVDFATDTSDDLFFSNKAGRMLGDTGNDMQIYGNKIYIVVSVSSTIEVLEKSTGNPIKQISMMNGTTAKQPRSLAFHNGKVFVSCYDGFVDVIDTVTLTISNRIQVGSNPEGMAVSAAKLYVANSGGLNSPLMDSTISIIDLTTLQEIKKVTVGKNPGAVVTDEQGDIYVISRGNYSSIPSRMIKLNTVTDEVETIFPFDASGIEKMNNNLLISYYNYTTSTASVAIFDASSENIINPTFIDCSFFTTFYGVQYDVASNKLFAFDAMSYSNTGYVRVFSSAGVYEKSYHVGLNPSKVIFYE